MKTAIVVGTVAVLSFGGTSAALAASNGTMKKLSTTGASFTNYGAAAGGAYSFDKWPCNSSCRSGKFAGFNYSGYLNDTKADGNAPFVHAKTDGYGYATRVYNHLGHGKTVYVSQKVWDTDGDPAQTAKVQACRDRGTLHPDNCVDTGTIHR